MTEEVATSSRPTRERKTTVRLEPEQRPEGGKSFSYAGGVGTPLGDISFFRHATDKLKSDDETLVLLHSLFFGSNGKASMRKRQLRLFSGFPENSPSRESLIAKISSSKKWTVSSLKNACALFGLERGGTRDDIISRLVDYIISPTEIKNAPASKIASSTKKRKKSSKKSKDKADKPKRALSAYNMYVQSQREVIKAKNPEASFGEVAKLLGTAWKSLSASDRAVWETAAAAANGEVDAGNNKKRRKTEDNDSADMDDGSDSDGESSGDEEDDRDKDLFPDAEEES